MTTRTTPFAPGTPCWTDLMTSDMAKAQVFYGGLLGWTFEGSPEEFGGYQRVLSDGHQVAGMMAKPDDLDAPDFWTTYLATADIEATIAAAEAAGATVHSSAMEVGPLGWMAMLTDPAGGDFGLWQAGEHTGFQKYNEPGSVTWDELQTKDYPAALDFYSKVFGWTVNTVADEPPFQYATGQIDGQDVAGVLNAVSVLPAQMPSAWVVYISVADVDATAAKVEGLGGAVLEAPQDTPFGRVADVSDPTGVRFRLHQVIAAA